MDHAHHARHASHAGHAVHARHHVPVAARPDTEPPGTRGPGLSLDRIAFAATLHCLSGCAIGEVAGMVIGTALGWGNAATVALAVALAFLSGFALTTLPLLRHGLRPAAAVRIALAADTASITVMEIVDNALMLLIPGAMDAPIDGALFWASLGVSLAVAGVAAFPVNRWLIARGRGHALAHAHH